MNKLIITYLKGKICTALTSERKVLQLTLEPKEGSSRLNHIYIGKVQKVVPGINAAFVDIGNGLIGYYSLTENRYSIFASGASKPLKAGDEIVVQVSRDAVKTKAPVLTSHLSFAGRFCVLTVGKQGISFSSRLTDPGYKNSIRQLFAKEGLDGKEGTDQWGLIIRTNAASVPAEVLLEEYRELTAVYLRLKQEWPTRTCYSCLYRSLPSYITGIRDSYAGSLEEIVTDQPVLYEELKDYLLRYQKEDADKLTLYEDSLLPLVKLYSLETVLDKALSSKVWLNSGGYLVIEQTEAMVVIDVNTGKYSGKKELEQTIRRINLEAADEVGHQLRLRNLSGIIMVDFIDMKSEEDKKELLRHLEEVASRDPVKTAVVDMTRLNLVEMTRKKVRRPLHEQVHETAGEV